MLRRILLPLSGSPVTPVAVRTAVDIAAHHDAHLTAISFRQGAGRAWLTPLGGASGVARLGREEEAATWQQIAEATALFTDACRAAGVGYEQVVPAGDPFDVLLRHGGAYDLVVFGLQGLFVHPLVEDPRRLIARLISGGIGPTLAVSHHENPPPRAILVALSGSPASARALRDLLHLGLYPEAELHLLHVGDDHAMVERAATLARDHGRQVASHTLGDGGVVRSITGAAQERGCGLVVMGDSGRSLLTRDVLGDVTLSMLRKSELPLLLSH